ncbi:MAG: hypothetical protein H7282_05890 [Cytophagaceae bacterium]|nr:hypothetical protein [Cytophagaceae bacterium]
MKKLLWFFLGLLLILVVLGFSLNRIAEHLANNNIEYLLDQNDPTRIYDYKFNKIKLDIWAGDLEINGVSVKPRKEAVDSLKRIGQPKRFLLEGQLNDIRLKGLDIIRLLTEKEVSIDSFIIMNPVIKLLVDPSVKPDTSGPALSKDLLSDKMTYGSINYLLLNNAKIRWINSSEDSSSYFSCDSVSLLVNDLYTDSLMMKSNQTMKFTEALFKGRNFDLNFIKDARLTAKGIDFKFSKNLLILDQVIFKNNGDRKEFTRELEYETAWHNLKIETLELTSKDIAHWGYMDYLKIDKVRMIDPVIVVYKDKRIKDGAFIVKPLPAKAIRDIKMPLLIENIEVKNGTATYEEISEKGKLPGRIYFTKINLKIHNFTNVKEVLHLHPSLIVTGSTDFLNKSTIVCRLDFPILDPREKFYAKGTITNVKATDLNNILGNMAYAEFTDGEIHKVSFQMTGDEEHSTGTVDAHYNNLKITLLDTASVNKKKEHIEKKFLGLLANTVVRSNNEPDSKHYVQGQIDLVRPKNKFVLNYIWNSIKVGLISTAVDQRLSKKIVEKQNDKIKEKERQ